MIVVDASVAVKWTVDEDLHSEALSLAQGDVAMIAPDLVVIETLNVLRRKVKRAEIEPAQMTRAAAKFPEVFDLLVPVHLLASDTVTLASSLDHSVYDCAYLACALKYNAPLITADLHFFRKTQTMPFKDLVLQLASGVDVALAAKLGGMSIEERALHLWHVFDRTVAHVRSLVPTLFEPSGAVLIDSGDLNSAFASPAYIRLKRFVAALSRAEQARLLATAWFGRSHKREPWDIVLAEATDYVATHDPAPVPYIIQTFATLAAGLERLQSDLSRPHSDRS